MNKYMFTYDESKESAKYYKKANDTVLKSLANPSQSFKYLSGYIVSKNQVVYYIRKHENTWLTSELDKHAEGKYATKKQALQAILNIQ